MDELAGACIELEHAIYGRCASHCFARMDEEEDEGHRAIATKNGVIMQPPIRLSLKTCTLCYNPFTRATPNALHAPQHPYRMRAGNRLKTHPLSTYPLRVPPPPAAARPERRCVLTCA